MEESPKRTDKFPATNAPHKVLLVVALDEEGSLIHEWANGIEYHVKYHILLGLGGSLVEQETEEILRAREEAEYKEQSRIIVPDIYRKGIH